MQLQDWVIQARAGDLEAYGLLVEATQGMVYAVARRVLADPVEAQDATQETYLRAYRRLNDLEDPAAFPGWVARIAHREAITLKRRKRPTFLGVEAIGDMPDSPENDEPWTQAVKLGLSRALLTLSEDDRTLCDRRYHGGWTLARLAQSQATTEPAMRKRLQRIREKLRKEMQMSEESNQTGAGTLPEKIVELLARPRLVDLPENPVGETLEVLRASFGNPGLTVLPEVIDLKAGRAKLGFDPVYIDTKTLHWIDETRVLRYDQTLPILLHVKYDGKPIRLMSAGKVYRQDGVSATHLEAFHQAEVFWMDDKARLDPWTFAGSVLKSIDAVLPGSTVRVMPTEYPMCTQAWHLEVDRDGKCMEVMAWGVFTPAVVKAVGGDPAKHSAMGAGYGLDRVAGLRHGVDDLRKMEQARV